MNEADRQTAVRINPARVAHETVDGEVIVIQLERGNYYSLAGAGREVWELLLGGLPPAEVAARLEQSYEADSDVVADAVADLVTRLHEEDLIEMGAPDGGSAPAQASSPPTGDAGAARPFEPPRLEKYTDMQDYLLIDPIHEVTETGWPTANGANRAE